MCLERLGHDQQTGRILVQTMHDPGARERRQIRGMTEQGILQGPIAMSGGRMDHQPRRLVDDQDLLVLEEDIQRDGLRQTLVARLEHGIEMDELTGADLVARAPWQTVDPDLTGLDPVLQTTARELGQRGRKHLIETPLGPIGHHPDLMANPLPARGGGRALSRKRLFHDPSDQTERAHPRARAGAPSGILSYTLNRCLESMRRTLARLPALWLAVALAGCGIFGKEIDLTESWSAAKLYDEASSELDSGNYARAIEYYEKLEARYPFGRYAMQSQLDVAYAHYRADEPEAAIAAADRFIKLYPDNPYVDYAYYLKGIVNYNRSVGFLDRYIPTDPSQRDPGAALDAFVDFSVLVERFPESRYAEDARQRMVYLRNNLAKHEVNVARYYMRRGAYLRPPIAPTMSSSAFSAPAPWRVHWRC